MEVMEVRTCMGKHCLWIKPNVTVLLYSLARAVLVIKKAACQGRWR